MTKFLDLIGVQTLWNKVKKLIKVDILDKLGVANGIATLDSNNKLSINQLPVLKTINGNSVVGSGNIELDLSLYKIVESLPVLDIDENKIYLVLSNGGGKTGDIYTEYIYANNKWEKLGEYKAEINIEEYLKKIDLNSAIEDLGYVKFTDTSSSTKPGIIIPSQFNKLEGIEERATADIALTETEIREILV